MLRHPSADHLGVQQSIKLSWKETNMQISYIKNSRSALCHSWLNIWKSALLMKRENSRECLMIFDFNDAKSNFLFYYLLNRNLSIFTSAAQPARLYKTRRNSTGKIQVETTDTTSWDFDSFSKETKNIKVVHLPLTMRKKTDNMDIPPPTHLPSSVVYTQKKGGLVCELIPTFFFLKLNKTRNLENLGGGGNKSIKRYSDNHS